MRFRIVISGKRLIVDEFVDVDVRSAYALSTSEKAYQEEHFLRNIGDSFKKIVIVNDDIMLRRNDAGVVTMSIRNFLLDEHVLER